MTYFQDAAGQVPANKDGDLVGLALNAPTFNNLYFYTIVFNYGKVGQRYLSDSEGLCFVEGDRYPLKVYESYEQAKKVMDKLAAESFPNEGILQICILTLGPVGAPSKGNLAAT